MDETDLPRQPLGQFLSELAARLPTLVVATAIKLVPAEAFAALAGPGFEAVPLDAVTAVVIGDQVVSPAEAGRRARDR